MKPRSWLHRAASRLARGLSLPWMLEPPAKVQLVPTNACNLRCKPCPKTWHDTDNRHMAPEVYERLREQVLPYAREAHLQGLGEPTLSPLFDRMIEDAARFGATLHFVTNTCRMTPERIRLLARCRAFVTVSLDGARAETHEWARTPQSNFEGVLAAMERMREARQASALGSPALHVNMVVTRRNIAEAADVVRLAGRYGAAAVALLAPGVGERQDEYALEAIGRHETLWAEHLPAIRAAARESGVRLQVPPYAEWLAEQRGETPESAPRPMRRAWLGATRRIFPRKCFAPFREAYFDVDGWVRPCCVAAAMGMGNLLESDFRSIWNNRHYRRMRRAVNSNNPPEICRRCGFAEGITGGDENFVAKYLASGGAPLPPPPPIGYVWSAEEARAVELDCRPQSRKSAK